MFIKASENTAIVWKENRISYNDLLKHISYYSTLFSADKIAIYSSNRPEWVYAFYAGWKNKSIPVPIDYLSKPEEVAYILNDCKPEVIFISIEQKGNIEEILPQLNYKIKVIVFDDIEYEFNNYPAEEIDTDDLERTSVIIYTSGTTGSPKGVMLSFENLMVNIVGVSEKIRIFTPERPVLVLLPLHHIFPLLGTMIMPLYAGALIAFSPSMVSEDIINTLQKNKIRIIIGVPRLYDLIRKGIVDKINKSFAAKMLFKLAHKINSKAFSKKIFHQVHEKFGGEVEYMVCGGAKLNEETARDYKALGFEMLEGYGMTECAPMISFTRPGRWKIGSAGEILPGLEVKIVDGEITAKGKNIMQGYYLRPEETAEVLIDGWIYTGDLGFVDNDGFIHITGRSKEIIVLSNGKNINPEEIENKLKESTDLISEVAVYSKNDILNVVIHPDFKKLHEMGIVHIEEKFRWDVIDAYNKNTSPSKKISKFYLSKEELPKTRLGKIKRYQLADLIETQAKEKKKIKEPEFQEYIVIRDFLKEQKQSEISPDDHLEIDLALDSLDKVNLQVFLESTFGVEVKDDIFNNNPTVEKLSNFMKEKKNKIAVETVKWAEILREKVDLKLPKSWFTQNLFKNTSKVFFKTYFRIKGEGIENIPQGPFILAPNHQSFFDGMFVSVFLKNKIFKNTYFYAKEKHVKHPLLKALASRNNIVVMDINKDLKQSLQKLAEILKKKKNIIIFPEGTRSRTGALGEFKKFFAILSKEFNVPVVPVSIKGANYALPKGKIFPRPWKKIEVKFHKPVYPDGLDYDTLTNKVYSELAEELT